jgi:D-tyrosyl-tRNA(Tyr) deacylase
MKAVIQRVREASVSVAKGESREISRIGKGVVTLLGFENADDETRLRRLLAKIVELRIFEDEAGKMNLSLKDIGGEHLLVSQFTLAADTSSGRRPSFTSAMRPELAGPLYERALALSAELGMKTQGGIFQADMKVSLINDGPVTFVLEA